MEIKIVCPYCGEENYIEEGYKRVFCSACGQKIEIKYTGGYLVVEPWMKTLEEAGLCMRMGEYEKAERMIAQLIKEQPGNCWLYRPYVEAITEDYSKMNQSNYGRVMTLVDKMIALAPEEEKAEAQDWKRRVQENYDVYEKYHEGQKCRAMAAEARINAWICGFFLLVCLLLFIVSVLPNENAALAGTHAVIFGLGTVLCVSATSLYILKYKKALRRFEKLDAEIRAWTQKVNSRVS